MSCLPTLARVNDLKRRLGGLKDEAETAVCNIKTIVDIAKSIVVSQESIHDSETFLKKYPAAVADLDVLSNNLVKLNCDLEIALSKNSDTSSVTNADPVDCEYRSCVTFSVDTQSVCVNTDEVCVNNFITYDLEKISKLYDIEDGSILEMKHVSGDIPVNFWLSYYPSEDYESHLKKLTELLSSGKCRQLSSPPSVGQFFIGSVFRGYVLAVYEEKIVTLDIDTGSINFTNICEAWEMEETILNFPPQAICCKLWHIPNEIYWCEELKQIFKKCMNKCDLVVTVKNVLPTIPPTFVVDIDAHDGTMLDFNVSEWINAYVTPGLEKLTLFSLSESTKELFFHDMDPYGVFCEENGEYDESGVSNHSDNISSVSENNNGSLPSDTAQNINLSDPFEKETVNITSQCIEEITEFPVVRSLSSHSSLNSFNNVDNITETTHTVGEETQSFVMNDFELTGSGADPFNSEIIDMTSIPLDENTKSSSLVIKEFVPRFNVVSLSETISHRKEKIEPAEVQCALEKGMLLEMFYIHGEDPWNFVLSNVCDEIEVMKKKIREKGEKGELKNFEVVPKANDFAIGECNGLYFRARVCGVLQGCNDDYYVMDIDLGAVKVINIFQMFIMEQEFASLPAKAIDCSLWNIARESPYWNTVLSEFFYGVMENKVLKVIIKDVVRMQNTWKHIVQVNVSCEVDYDLSEWIMLHVIPKLQDIRKMDINNEDCFPVVKALDPLNLFTRKRFCQTYSEKSSCRSLGKNLKLNPGSNSKSQLRKPRTLSGNINIPSTPKELSSFSESDGKCSKFNDLILPNNDVNVNSYSSFDSQKLDDVLCLTDFKSISDLKIGKKYFAFLSNVYNPGEFYIHVASDVNTHIDEMQGDLQEYCSGESINYQTKSQAKQLISLCCAVYFEGQWCRARVVDWMDNSSPNLQVFMVDYGLYATVPFSSVQYLKSDFFKYPVFALRCKLAFIEPPDNCEEWPEETNQYFLNVLDYDIIYTLVIESFSVSGVASVFLSTKDDVESVNDYLVNESLAVTKKEENSSKDPAKCHSIVYPPPYDDMFSDDDFDDLSRWKDEELIYFDDKAATPPEIGENLLIVITEIVNVVSFYGVATNHDTYRGRVSNTSDVLVEMSKKIRSAVNGGRLKRLKSSVVGSIVVACFSRDKVWYRARLLSPIDDNGFAEVYFVDYGNTDFVSKDQIREISKEFSSLPFQAMKFFINGLDLNDFSDALVNENCMNILCLLLGKCEVNVKVVNIINGDIFVDVFSEGNNIAHKILAKQAKLKSNVCGNVAQLIDI